MQPQVYKFDTNIERYNLGDKKMSFYKSSKCFFFIYWFYGHESKDPEECILNHRRKKI